MKNGKSLQELAAELTRVQESKRDYIAPGSKLTAVAELQGGARGPVALNIEGTDVLPLTPYAHGQVAQYLGIPTAYYRRMEADAPELLASSINRWMGDHAADRRMVRTLDGHVRAILSDRYRQLENYDLGMAILPVLNEIGGGLDVVSCDLTDTRLYIKAVDRDREANIARAFEEQGLQRGGGHHIIDVVSPAIVISNSEIGAGALQISASMYTKACTNLAVWDGGSFRKYHLGARAGISDEVYALLTDGTKAITDQSVFMQARDVTRAAFDEQLFKARVEKLEQATEDETQGDVVEVVEQVGKQFTLTEGERSDVLQHLIRGGQLNRYGVHAAITRAAEDSESYDRASELEKVGARVIELPRNEWERIGHAQPKRKAA